LASLFYHREKKIYSAKTLNARSKKSRIGEFETKDIQSMMFFHNSTLEFTQFCMKNVFFLAMEP